MKQETMTILKQEKNHLKRKSKSSKEEIDWEFVNKIKRALEDVKHGRITEWKPKSK